MDFNEKISLVLLCYNEEQKITQCLESLIQQSVPPQEIILIDNGSTDNTVAIIESIQKHSKLITLIKNKRNNLGYSRSLGVHTAKSKFVAFIDADCIAPSNWLEVLIQGYTSNQELYKPLAAVGGSNSPPENISSFYDAQKLMYQSFLGHLNSPQSKLFKENQLVQHLSTCNVLYNKKFLVSAGNFSENFSTVCEDVDISKRLRQKNFNLLMLSDSNVIHYTCNTSSSWFERIFRFGHGQFLVIDKHPSHFSFRLSLPIFFFLWLCSIFTLFSSFPIIVLASLFLYVSILLFVSLKICSQNKKILLTPYLFFLFFNTHLAYAIGESYGLLQLTIKNFKRKYYKVTEA